MDLGTKKRRHKSAVFVSDWSVIIGLEETQYYQGFAILRNSVNQQEKATTDIVVSSCWFICWIGMSICKRKLSVRILK